MLKNDKMTEITKKILEKELKRYKLLNEKKDTRYYDGSIATIRRLLKILEKKYVEEKDKTCPFKKREKSDWSLSLCEGERCQCWSIKKNGCGLKNE